MLSRCPFCCWYRQQPRNSIIAYAWCAGCGTGPHGCHAFEAAGRAEPLPEIKRYISDPVMTSKKKRYLEWLKRTSVNNSYHHAGAGVNSAMAATCEPLNRGG